MLQTVLDLLRSKFPLKVNVYLVADAVVSQRQEDRDTAIERMKAAGKTR